MNHLELLESDLRLFQLDFSVEQRGLLSLYCDELERWNRKMNLTGLQGLERIRRLVVEPIWIARQLEIQGVLVDIGSGNGSPALPIHVVRRLERVHLFEVRTKRAVFLRYLVSTLKTTEVVVHQCRFEEFREELPSIDWVTLQGVALTRNLLDSIRRICTRRLNVAWITAAAEPEFPPSRTLCVPMTGTRVLLFHMDQS